MKRILFTAMIAALTGCGEYDYPIWEGPGATDVVIDVENANGDNLLDPGFGGNILGRDITAKYDGEIYDIEDNSDEVDPKTRAFPPPRWKGLRLDYNEISDSYSLRFGEFGGGRDQVFVINFGDDVDYEVKFDYYSEAEGRRKKRHYHIYRKTWLNGELQYANSHCVTIVK